MKESEGNNEQPIFWWFGWGFSALVAPYLCLFFRQLLCTFLTSLHPRNSNGELNYLANYIVMFLDHPRLESGVGAFMVPFLFVSLSSGFAPHSRYKISQWFSVIYWFGSFVWMGLEKITMTLESTPVSAMVWLLPLSIAGNLSAVALMRFLDWLWSRNS